MSFIQMGNAWRRSGERQQQDAERQDESLTRQLQREALTLGLEQARERPQREAQEQAARVMSRRRGAQILRTRLGESVKDLDDDTLGELWEKPEMARQVLPAEPSEVNWQTEVDNNGNVVRLNPRTGKTEYVNSPEGGRLQARPPASLMVPQPVQFLQTPEGYVAADPRNPGAPVRPVRGAGGEQVRPATGGVEIEKRAAVLRNVGSALDGFEQTLRQTGSVLDPRKPEHGVLKAAYENYQLQLKELYALGVLAGPDLGLMRSLVNDPTDPKTRLLSGGNAQAHAQRVLAQIQQGRRVLGNYMRNAVPARDGQSAAQGVSDDDVNAIIGRYRGSRE